MPEEPMLVFGPYPDVPMSLQSSWLRVDWYNAGEGWWGDYNPGNPEDENLLRFDVYVRRGPQRQEDMDDGWQEVEDASYCTRIPANGDSDILERALRLLFKEYKDALENDRNRSVKKLGEALSWISPAAFQ